ncbi:MAG: pilus assembly protein PilM [Desulfuromonas sp.]|nr:MAG: pilus assembly protein PilM [Desulfuromonas sp.]
MLRKKRDLIGIDIGASSIKLIQLKQVRGQFELVNMGIVPLAPEVIVDNSIMDPGAIVEALGGLVESLKVKTKNVATSVSGHSVIIRKIQLPIMTEEEAENSIQFEAEQFIPFDISEVNLDFQILGPDAKDPSQMAVLLVAAKKDFVNDHTAVFLECGFQPVVMDIDCFALENAFNINYDTAEDEIVALIDMGASSLNVNILKEGVSVFTRDIQMGGNLLNEELQKRLGVSDEDAESLKLGGTVADVDTASVDQVVSDSCNTIVQEVQRSLDFFAATSAEEKVSRLFLSGGASKSDILFKTLQEKFEFEVELLNPFNQLIVSEKSFDLDYLEAMAPLFSVAVGLGMRRIGDK